MSEPTLADFAHDIRCNRSTFTLIKRGKKAVQWCSWCRSMLKLNDACPVGRAVSESQP